MQLIVAEKPSVARDLARVLGVRAGGQHAFEGERHVITWCIGHLVELDEPAAYDPRWKAWRLDTLPMLPAELRLRPAKHGAAHLRAVARLLRERRFTSVVNACDAGREGELIFRYVVRFAGGAPPVRRLWISSLTDEAIRRGMAGLRPGADYDALGDAARSRSEADWLVGMNATRAVTVRGRSGGQGALYSIGRVQTPTLAMLVEREHAIRGFVPRDYWEVHGQFQTAAGARFTAGWRHGAVARLGTAALADAIVSRDRAHSAAADPIGPRVERVRARTVREPAPLLFDLTSLQRTANRRFGWSAARTLELAQVMYERHKLLTYPRTDSRHLTTDVVAQLPALFAALATVPEYAAFAGALVARPPRPGKRIVDDAKVHDHHAIIPTGKVVPAGTLDRDERRLFDLVVRRFLGGFFPDAEIAVSEVWIRVGAPAASPVAPAPRAVAGDGGDDARADGERPALSSLPAMPDRYRARGRSRLVAGWQEVAGIDGGEERREDGERDAAEASAALPPLVEGQALDGAFTPLAKQTTPPPRYTDATLLGAMESAGRTIDDEALRAAMKDCGLGTPATRAAVIETLLKRDYVERARQQLVPTALGIGLIAALPVTSLASPALTGSWERRLARIARGEETRAAFMADIARYVADLVDAIRGSTPPAAASGEPPRARTFPARTSPARVFPARTPPSRTSPSRTTPSPASSSRTSLTRPAGRASTPRAAKVARRVRGDRDAPRGPTPRAARPARDPAVSSAAAAVAVELGCPRCKAGTLIAGSRGWGCSRWRAGCGFVVWFETAGRRLGAAQLRDLITRGKTRKARFVPAGGGAVTGWLVLEPAAAGGARFQPG